MKVVAQQTHLTYQALKSRTISGQTLKNKPPEKTNPQKISAQNFKLDLKISWKAKKFQQHVGKTLEDNIKFSIDASLKASIQRADFKVALENQTGATSIENLKVNLKIALRQKTVPHQISQQKVSDLLNVDLKIDRSSQSFPDQNISQLLDEKMSDFYSDNILEFVKSRFNLFSRGENLNEAKIEDFFKLIKKAVEDGFKSAIDSLGDLGKKLEGNLGKTVEKAQIKIEHFELSLKEKSSSKLGS